MTTETKTWTVYATKIVVMSATFSITAEDIDDAYDLAEWKASREVLSWEDNDPRGGRIEVQDVEEDR